MITSRALLDNIRYFLLTLFENITAPVLRLIENQVVIDTLKKTSLRKIETKSGSCGSVEARMVQKSDRARRVQI